jgi:hypothetical protein
MTTFGIAIFRNRLGRCQIEIYLVIDERFVPVGKVLIIYLLFVKFKEKIIFF